MIIFGGEKYFHYTLMNWIAYLKVMEPRQRSRESTLLPGMDVYETLRQTLQGSLKHSKSPRTFCRLAQVQKGKPCLNICVMSYPYLSVAIPCLCFFFLFTCAHGSPQEPETCTPWSWTTGALLASQWGCWELNSLSHLSVLILWIFKTKSDLLKSYAPKFSINIHLFTVPVFTIVLMWTSI